VEKSKAKNRVYVVPSRLDTFQLAGYELLEPRTIYPYSCTIPKLLSSMQEDNGDKLF